VSVGITIKFPPWLLAIQQRESDIYLLIAATLQTNRGMMFDQENAGRPTPWAPLKLRQGQPLSKTGALRQSFAPRNDGVRPGKGAGTILKYGRDNVTIGTDLAYAPIHNLGGVIRPVKGQFLWIPLPDGKANSANAPTDEAKALRKSAGRKRKADTGWKWVKQPNGGIVVRAPSGKVYLLAKKVTIPKRPMDEWVDADQRELEAVVTAKITEVLNGAH
jgi:phage gpG-like protein